jgi:signal transduction histidine kinase
VPEHEASFLIADVAALTGVPAPQLRSWEESGILHPRRSPNATRLYSIENVAQVRLIKRSLLNPGRRGSLLRVGKELASGALVPSAADYAGLVSPEDGAQSMSDALYWQSVVDAMAELVVVCDSNGRATSINSALRAMLPVGEDSLLSDAGRSKEGCPLPAALQALPLRWSALTGSYHRDVELVLQGSTGSDIRTIWTVTPLRSQDEVLRGAVAVGRAIRAEPLTPADDLLALAVHSLRNPLTIILGRLQLARRAVDASLNSAKGIAAEQLDQHLALAELSTMDLVRAMNTLFDASAAAHRALIQQMEPGPVELESLARQAVEHAQLHSRRHMLSIEVNGTPLHVVGDRARLRQVFDYLLDNAIKYSPDGGPITIRMEALTALPSIVADTMSDAGGSAAPERQWVAIRISDTGLGISADALPHVFGRFWRAAGVKTHIRGTGLGLYACRAIVAAHGGHIWVEDSATLGDGETSADGRHGTVIDLVLPLSGH